MVGSVYEHRSTKSLDFPLFGSSSRFTDDTVLTVATAEAVLDGKDYDAAYRSWAVRYPFEGYGGTFRRWMFDPGMGPYQSWGNGSAMRVSPVGWAFSSEAEVLREAEASAAVTHDHPEGIKGARAVALAVFLARSGHAKEEIRAELERTVGYDLRATVATIRPHYGFDVSCHGSVPQAIIAFLDSESFESSIRLAVSLGGDADTQAAIAGSIAEAFHGRVPEAIAAEVYHRLPLEMQDVVDRFTERFRTGYAGAGE